MSEATSTLHILRDRAYIYIYMYVYTNRDLSPAGPFRQPKVVLQQYLLSDMTP